MRQVLFISYLYPPLNCGVGRQVKIVKYLPKYGWQPIVLSVKKSNLRPLYDSSVLKDVPNEATVYRTGSCESRLFMHYLPRVLKINPKWIQIPDKYIGWYPFALFKGLDIINKHNIDAIFSTSLPLTCHLIALKLHQKTGIPWLADFRDPWTSNNDMNYPDQIRNLERKWEYLVIHHANKITTVTEPITDYFRKQYHFEPPEKFLTITHGYDPDDFPKESNNYKDNTNEFTIFYTGSLYGDRRLEVFFQAIQELVNESSEIKDSLKIKFIGNVIQADLLLKRFCLSNNISTFGMLPHSDIFKLLSSSDALLLILGSSETYIQASTGKLFEYIASKRPILALVPEGVAANIIRETNAGIVINPDDKRAIKKAIMTLYRNSILGKKIITNKQIIDEYDVIRKVQKFASLLDDIKK